MPLPMPAGQATPLQLNRMQAGKRQSGGLVQTQHAVHGLYTVAGAALDEIVQRRNDNHAAAVGIALKPDVAEIGAAEDLRFRIAVGPPAFP